MAEPTPILDLLQEGTRKLMKRLNDANTDNDRLRETIKELRLENEQLKHDLDRHIGIASDLATEVANLSPSPSPAAS